MTLFGPPQYWHIFDELLDCNSSPVDTGYGGDKGLSQGKNEIRYIKVLCLMLRLTPMLSPSPFPLSVR